jgi:hypothetical protein
VDITLAVKYGGAETIMVGPPEQIEILWADLFQEWWNAGVLGAEVAR